MEFPDLNGLLALGCDHTHRDYATFGSMNDVPRCIKCGDLFLSGNWYNVPRFVLSLIISGSESKAVIEYMNKAREEDDIPYPEYTLAGYKEIAAFLAEKDLVNLFKIKQYYEEDGNDEEDVDEYNG